MENLEKKYLNYQKPKQKQEQEPEPEPEPEPDPVNDRQKTYISYFSSYCAIFIKPRCEQCLQK